MVYGNGQNVRGRDRFHNLKTDLAERVRTRFCAYIPAPPHYTDVDNAIEGCQVTQSVVSDGTPRRILCLFYLFRANSKRSCQ